MKGMVLAAGLGTRLGKITEHTPKCLVDAGGKTLLEHTFLRLQSVGVDAIVVNVHHLAPAVELYLDSHKFPGLEIQRSFEARILETGGGVKHASSFLQGSGADSGADFFVHNADVFTTVDLSLLCETRARTGAEAVLLVAEQPSSRGLLVNTQNQLCGWQRKDDRQVVRPAADLRLVNFCGIQLCSQAIWRWMEPLGDHFSIIEAYLAGVRAGAQIVVAPIPPAAHWFDIGTPERLETLRGFLRLRDQNL